MADNENIKVLEGLHNKLLNNKSLLEKINHGELSALFHVRRILECQEAEIKRLKNLESLEKFIYKKAHNIGTDLECDFVDKEARDIAYESVINKLVDIEIARKEAIKEFAERLCKGRVSNDPVVIAVKVEFEMMKEQGVK